MAKQNYTNHVRWYPAHHFIFYPVIFFLFIFCLFFLMQDEGNRVLWAILSVVVLLIGTLSLMLRQHYALINQNRTVRLELRFRYYVLTHKRFELVEHKLTAGQIYALRFAGDDELAELVERAINEKLSADAIKRVIKNWLPDEMRV